MKRLVPSNKPGEEISLPGFSRNPPRADRGVNPSRCFGCGLLRFQFEQVVPGISAFNQTNKQILQLYDISTDYEINAETIKL
ncbi:Hypothetical protein CINCED_3A022242 [Cinara cedri]|uniref:Uncharacterized protein n=1 Tax=Cinara cedri TaxID=506608 RepID=A0A5E4MBA0_9HEMI|nr:Hypothetical protein CINCED_3A022242 [Cinara cedri]